MAESKSEALAPAAAAKAEAKAEASLADELNLEVGKLYTIARKSGGSERGRLVKAHPLGLSVKLANYSDNRSPSFVPWEAIDGVHPAE